LSKKTRDAQKDWADKLRTLRFAKKAPTSDPYYASYDILPGRKICLASGDMTEMQNIDVLVNTENNYMEMARIYESAVLSSALRREGSYIRNGKILEDTVQLELDQQVTKGEGFGSRPIEMEQVIPTHAGHAKSALVKNGARYIFHASTVYVHPRNRSVTPIQTDASVRQTVLNCLNLLMDVNENKGVIAPPDSEAYAREQKAAESFVPLKSIIFPLFGAGQGGRSTIEVAPPMIECFKDFLRKHKSAKDFPLESIHLCVFTEVDVAVVKTLMDDMCK
jgi:O-acetyl-ADP-ribose deacetylase (regulator of RNase III)